MDDLRERVAELVGINLNEFLEEGKGVEAGGQAQKGKTRRKVGFKLTISLKSLKDVLTDGRRSLDSSPNADGVHSVEYLQFVAYGAGEENNPEFARRTPRPCMYTRLLLNATSVLVFPHQLD